MSINGYVLFFFLGLAILIVLGFILAELLEVNERLKQKFK